jgi:enterochelin esterase family protein
VGEWAGYRPDAAVRMSELAPGVWVGRTALPVTAYVEYAYLIDGHRRADPLNRYPASDGNDGRVSGLWMARAPREADEMARLPASAVPRGELTRHRLETGRMVAGHSRTTTLYRPPGGTTPADLLVILDGQDYIVRQRVHRIVDVLVARRRIAPIGIAFVNHGGDARFAEYACSEGTLAFVAERVLPFARARLGVADRPAVIAGPSLGGLMALFAGLRRPDLFDRVIAQSGTFELPGREMITGDLVRHLPPSPIRIRLSAGTFEWLAGPVARLADLLRARGYDVTHRPYAGGHNHRVWAEDLVRGLEAMFPPPGGRSERQADGHG